MLLAIGTYSVSGSAAGHVKGELGEGVYTYSADADGRLTPSGQPPLQLPHPTYVCKHPRLPVIYATLENMEAEDGEALTSEIAAIKVEASGSMSMLNKIKVPVPISCHIMADADGKFVFVGCYMPNAKNEGRVPMISLREDGGLDTVLDAPVMKGEPSAERGDAARNGFDAGRQSTSHPHCAQLCHLNGAPTLLVADLGLDLVHRFAVSDLGLQFDGSAPVPLGSGPRHTVVDDASRLAYVVCELTSKVLVLSLDSMTVVQEVSTLPDDVNSFEVPSECAAIKFSANRQFLYASNRGHDSIVVMKLDAGRIGSRSWCSIGGRTPRDFFVDPDGRFVLAFGQDSGTIARLIVTEDGALQETGDVYKLAAPVTCCNL